MTEKLKTLAKRIEHVGRALYGRFWTVKMAAGLGISRSQLFEYRRPYGGKTDRARDLDCELVALIEREQALSQERAAGLTVLRIEIERTAGIARKRSKREQEAEHVA
ncbi:hypothetical protein SSBR45G_46630 [Bradyrhizobium sp. SSBR45G]|uniref:hypothetical protein n=1 Tax=unclassified Bradyrhizobium TaxID=2631580 RepID=UPI0023429B07|nr:MULTISPECIES: hypothetical protein [unclassified Bradyrhizobium]GLH79754.1 hypothetical protein SSBR45G_46630 [Bradyrhizobium sp. SSBR45G]GLH87128.1 hypothetical protein SSBR45R_45880 [Bradyrhizobium sp. SSBR45R]